MELTALVLLPVLAVLAAATWILWKLLRGLFFVLGVLFRGIGHACGGLVHFVRAELVEAIQLLGAILTLPVLLALSLLNVPFGRLGTSRHYLCAMRDEAKSAGLGVYRMALAHPLRLVGLGGLLDGIERRVPEVVGRAPRRPRKGDATRFDGYRVIGTLPRGGSGAELFVARPLPETCVRLARPDRPLPEEVVIKSFALASGSTLPQIVRESRALEAARRLGLVLDHHLDPERFYYVMEYVRGDDLARETRRLHGRSGPEGLGEGELRLALGWVMDVLRSLERFHTGGLWHKDVKPSNVIVAGGRAHLVDFGLVTSLSSSLTLTTHGTEYYRDPEMVRLAMKGVKVHEVDGVKFDLYSTGALLYSLLEDSFPAHGSLSRISKRCPEALAWVVRRAMAEIDTRYGSASEMLADLEVIATAPQPDALRPADLPSMGGAAAAGFRAEPAGFEPRSEEDAEHEPAGAEFERPFVLLADRMANRAKRWEERQQRWQQRWEERRLGREERRAQRRLRREQRSRFVPRVLAAALAACFVLAPLACIAAFVLPTSMTHESVVAQATPYAVPMGSRAVADIPRRVQSELSRRGITIGTAPSHSVPAPEPAPYTELRGARVLVLDDLAHAAGDAAVERESERLRSAGADLVTAGSPNGLELISSVRWRVQTDTQGDEEATARLQEFLDGSGQLDAVLWLAADREPELVLRTGFEGS